MSLTYCNFANIQSSFNIAFGGVFPNFTEAILVDEISTKVRNIPRIGKLPYGAKRGFIERKGLLKERLY